MRGKQYITLDCVDLFAKESKDILIMAQWSDAPNEKCVTGAWINLWPRRILEFIKLKVGALRLWERESRDKKLSCYKCPSAFVKCILCLSLHGPVTKLKVNFNYSVAFSLCRGTPYFPWLYNHNSINFSSKSSFYLTHANVITVYIPSCSWTKLFACICVDYSSQIFWIPHAIKR